MRGGAHAPMPDAELEAKFMDNARYGGWSHPQAERLRHLTDRLFTLETLDVLREHAVA